MPCQCLCTRIKFRNDGASCFDCLHQPPVLRGFTVETVYSRVYPEKELFAHILGYVGRISDKEQLEELQQQGYDEKDLIGKTGLESVYESELRGENGIVNIELDGKTNQRISETVVKEATRGNDLFITIDRGSVQEVMDLGAVAHLAAIKGRVPFVHFFDGFRTSHEIQKIEMWDYDDLKDMLDMDAVKAFRERALNPNHPVLRGSAQNPDIFFQAREASNPYYEAVPAIVEEYMDKVNAKIGTNYKLFNYYGAEDATEVIIAMGSVCDTIEETVDYMNAHGSKVGLVKVRLYRPFSAKHLIDAIPRPRSSVTQGCMPYIRASPSTPNSSAFSRQTRGDCD